MNKLAEISRARKQAHQKLKALESPVYGAFLQMESATYKDGALPKKVKELIAIGISVYADCESCMQWHIDQAATIGASTSEVLEAIEVGIAMGAGRRTVSARFALEVMDDVYDSLAPHAASTRDETVSGVDAWPLTEGFTKTAPGVAVGISPPRYGEVVRARLW